MKNARLPTRLGAVALLAAAAYLTPLPPGAVSASAQTTASDSGTLWEMHEIAPGVYASIVAAPTHPASFSNSLVIVQDDHVVVVDTRESPEAARALLADIRAITDKPVTTVINTHWHSDHVFGNQVFAEEFPGVEILAHPAVLAKLRDEGKAMLTSDRDRHRGSVERWQGWLDAGQTPQGRVLDDADRKQLQDAIARSSRLLQSLDEVRITLPTDTVPGQRILDPGPREIRVIHPGPAHTRGDLVVYIPSAGVLAAGDLIEQGFPYFGDGTIVGSAWALDRLSLLDVTRIVPAHARLQERTELLDTQRSFLRAVVDATRRGETPQESVEGFRSAFTGGDPAADGRFDSFVADLATSAATENDTIQSFAGACGAPEHRAFDFWIGSWEVTGPGGDVVGHNRIESAHGGCALRENWTGATGSVGQSFNSYDRTRGVWHQTWVDNSGLLLLLDGNPIEGGMRLAGETTGADGAVTQHRITWTVEADDGSLVRQLWESSTDDGTTWTVAFNGLYRRTAP